MFVVETASDEAGMISDVDQTFSWIRIRNEVSIRDLGETRSFLSGNTSSITCIVVQNLRRKNVKFIE
jgi:hypothetical protein